MITLATLENFGVAPEFLKQIGTAPEEFRDELMHNKELQAQYSEDAIQSFLTPSYDALPISSELEYMLGIPPIPVGIDPDLRNLYYAIRQLKYRYKLMRLIGFVCVDDLPSDTTFSIRNKIAAFNHTTRKHMTGVSAAEILLGRITFYLPFLINYPFLHKEEFEHTAIPREL